MTKKKQNKQSNRGRPKNERGGLSKAQKFRFSDRTMFALRWIQAIEGAESLTAIVEDVIDKRAEEVMKKHKPEKHWLTLFSADPGIATLNLYALPGFTPSTHERSQHHFVTTHAAFFFDDDEMTRPHKARASILWPKIDEFRALWDRERADDHWSAAKAMAAELKKHGEPAPKSGGRW